MDGARENGDRADWARVPLYYYVRERVRESTCAMQQGINYCIVYSPGSMPSYRHQQGKVASNVAFLACLPNSQ